MEHVLERRRVEVLLQVVERVLRDVRQPQVRVAPDLRPGVRLVLAGHDLDQRRLAGAVDAEDGDARGEAHHHVDVGDLGARRAGVRERHLVDLLMVVVLVVAVW